MEQKLADLDAIIQETCQQWRVHHPAAPAYIRQLFGYALLLSSNLRLVGGIDREATHWITLDAALSRSSSRHQQILQMLPGTAETFEQYPRLWGIVRSCYASIRALVAKIVLS